MVTATAEREKKIIKCPQCGTNVRTSPLGLTHSELGVLELLAQGLSNVEIAKQRFIQPRTVEHHINSIFAQLGLTEPDGRHRRVSAALSYWEYVHLHHSEE